MKNNYLKHVAFVLFTIILCQVLQAQTLRSLAAKKGKYIGNLMRDEFFGDFQINNGSTDSLMKTEYNAIVAGNMLKMSSLLRTRPADPFNVQIGDIDTATINRFVRYAETNGMRKRGHVMIWHNQIPAWLRKEVPGWTAQQVYDFTKSYIFALSSFTSGKIDEWDVLNEALITNGFRTGTWYDVVNTQANDSGQIGYNEFFASLFKWARQGNPKALLYYNDYGMEMYGIPKNNTMRRFVKDLKNVYGAPVDGVGLQSHFLLNELTNDFIAGVGQTIDDLGNSGFTVNISELDIRICGENPVTQSSLDAQRAAYKGIVSTALSRTNCNTVLIWGLDDADSWIPRHKPGCGYATPCDSGFQRKPAYYGVQDALKSL